MTNRVEQKNGLRKLPTVVIIGPLPPPVHGVTVAIKRLLESNIGERLNVIHVDTSDHRDPSTIGAIDLRNYVIALVSYFNLALACLRFRPDAVYVPISQTRIGYARDALYFIITRALSHARIIVHLHGGHFGDFYRDGDRITRYFVDITMRFVDRAIVLSDCFTSIFRTWLPPERIDVVTNGSDLVIAGISEKVFGPPRMATSVTFLSSLMRSKGIIDFLTAAMQCLDEGADLNFNVAGEWWEEDSSVRADAYASIIPRHRNRIRFLGVVTGAEKSELFRTTDIFVLPTYYRFEGQPTVILEAMSAGCAVIATNHAAISETVVDGLTGILVPPKDPPALSAAIMRFAQDPVFLSDIRRAGYLRYCKFYTAEASNSLLIDSIEAGVTVAQS